MPRANRYCRRSPYQNGSNSRRLGLAYAGITRATLDSQIAGITVRAFRRAMGQWCRASYEALRSPAGLLRGWHKARESGVPGN